MKKTIVALALGLLIGSAGTALAASETVQAVFGKFNFVVNGEVKELKTDPLVVDGTSYLPVREVAGLLGFRLDYDADSRTIKLDNKLGTGSAGGSTTNQTKGGSSMETITDEWISLQELTQNFGIKINANSNSLSLSKNELVIEIKFIRNGDEIIGGETSSGNIGLRIKDSETQLKLSDLRAVGIVD